MLTCRVTCRLAVEPSSERSASSARAVVALVVRDVFPSSLDVSGTRSIPMHTKGFDMGEDVYLVVEAAKSSGKSASRSPGKQRTV